MAHVLADISSFYEREVVEAGKEAQLLLIVSFLVTFAIVRAITHAIRSRRFPWLGNVEVGTTHVHHMVFGILIVLLTGYLAISLDFFPEREVLAVLFGVGAALTLDEFALWLNLKDVYWTKQGRRSVDAVTIAAIAAVFVLLGVHFWASVLERAKAEYDALYAGIGATGLIVAVICVLKGRIVLAILGFYIPVAGLFGAVRLARPRSWWATRYPPEKLERAEARFKEKRAVPAVAAHR